VLDPGDPADRDRLDGLYGAATCFVMPSLHEPSALSYVEAAGAGVPVIGTTAGGTATLVGDGGVLVEPGDEAALREAMLALAVPATAARLGELASARARLFTWDAVGERLLAALRGHDDGGYL
jgi:glycosyltransferase involved in cell wall biosynthesis